ncbi:hypothetical protein MMC16_006873 [Acarospora aff. strigata]|nr:hypothetical protein [Acarospora aff. strigata]
MHPLKGCLVDQEALSDDKIQEILDDAKQRLSCAQSEADPLSVSTKQARPHKPCNIDSSFKCPKLHPGDVSQSYIISKGDIARVDSARLVSYQQRESSTRPRRVEDPISTRKASKKEARPTAGADWFDLPRTKLTPELKRDLQLIQLRSVLDPKRHYKKEDTRRTAPQFSQVGTILEGPTEFYSARLLQKDRKKTFVDEVLAGEKTSGRFKRKYSDIQAAKSSGKKAHYNELKARRASKA